MQQTDRLLPPTHLSRIKSFLPGKSSKLFIAGGIAAVLIIAGALFWYNNQPVLDRSLVSDADFTVYAPKSLPAGYELDQERTNFSNGVVTYGFSSQSVDKDITVTVQSRPAGFDMSSVSKGGSINSTTTPNGTLYNLSVGGASQYMLDTGDSLIYITSPSSVDINTINSLVADLTKVN